MATATVKAQCFICNKEKITYKCLGCSQEFCFTHLAEHQKVLGGQLDEILNDHDQFRQTILEQKNDPEKHLLIKQIDEWEEHSIYRIKQTAEQCRQRLLQYICNYTIELENKLKDLAEKMKETRQEGEFNEVELNQFKEKFKNMKEELDQPSHISIKQESTSFIDKIFVIFDLDLNATWKQTGSTIAAGNGSGNGLKQLYQPLSISIDDDDQTMYVADTENDRIVQWKSHPYNGQISAGGNGRGNQTNQLKRPANVIIDKKNNSLIIADQGNRRVMRWPRQNNANGQLLISDIDCWGLAMDKNGDLYVSDYKKNEVRRWKTGDQEGTIVAGGHEEGDDFDQLNCPSYIFVDEDYSLYVSDYNNHRIMKWPKDAKEGIIVAGGNGQGESLTQLSYPYGLVINQLDQIFVADYGNHRVMRWCKDALEGTIVVGGNEAEGQSNQLNGPADLSFDREGNLYIVDQWNNRIQKFEIE